MTLRKLLFSAFVILPLFAAAQQTVDYKELECQGHIPSEFLTLSSQKYKTAADSLLSASEGEEKKTKQTFLLESSFLINQVLGSGRVLFNDPVSTYLSQILDTVLINEPELRSKVRVYALRSSLVNSFTTDDGIILVSLGLVAQLENEAQLAFVLCHELVHFTERHVINAYVQNEELKRGAAEYKRGSFDEGMLAKSGYSKDLEKEADRLGLKRFLDTRYSSETVSNVFDVMRYAHLPFDDIAFEKEFFDQAYYRMDDSYFLNQVRPVEANENENPESDTHPSPTERQQLIGRYINNGEPRANTSNHLISEERFKALRNSCRFELSNLYLKSNQPVLSIYNSYLLRKSFPENPFLQKNIAKALYTLSKFKTGGNYGYVHPGFSHIEGESQQLYHLFYRLQPEELCILATGFIWRLRLKYPDDVDVKAMSEDILKDLIKFYHTPGMFAQERPPEGWDIPDTTAITNKYDRLKQKSKDNPKLTMVTYALVDLFENDGFVELFDRLEKKRWGGEDKSIARNELIKQSKDDQRRWKNHGFSLGLQRVAVVTPTYTKLDLRKKQQHKFLHSESAKQKLVKQIEKSTDLLNLDTKILDITLLDSSEVNTFNDITFLNEWVDQRFLHVDVDMVNLNQARIDSIIARYGTEYYAWTGVINYRENKPLMLFYLLYALIPPAIPLAVYYLARPNYDTYYYCITFNLKTGEPVQVNYNNYRKRDARDLMNSSIYDSFWQMKQKPRKG
ncbi:MAG: M48 family metallopeptidase [Flavobacteriales bacterium]|nr:M48 family metallopeptidase [Flavobacteriales bacterium]